MAAPAPKSNHVKKVQPSQAAPPENDWWVEVVDDRSQLHRHALAWQSLAENAAEPNAFYEPWLFLPGAGHFEPETPLACVFVYRRPVHQNDSPRLCGVFPFERRRRFRGLPISSLRLWEPAFVLSTPLIHRDFVREVFRQLFDWASGEDGCSLIEMPMIHGEGPLYQALVDVLNERRMQSFVDEVFNRAFIRRAKDAASYCSNAMDKETLRNYRRLRRRLAEHGTLEFRTLQPDGDVDIWIEQFITLEAAGWKGREQTAIGAIGSSQAIFREAGRNGHALGKLQMLGLFVNDRPIALKCNYLTGNGGFTYKIAYDESFAKFSPGVLLELDNIE